MTDDIYSLNADQKTDWSRQLNALLIKADLQQKQVLHEIQQTLGNTRGSKADLSRFINGDKRVLQKYLGSEPEIGGVIAETLGLPLTGLRTLLEEVHSQAAASAWHPLFPQVEPGAAEVEVRFEFGLDLQEVAKQVKTANDGARKWKTPSPKVILVATGAKTRTIAVRQLQRELTRLEVSPLPHIIGEAPNDRRAARDADANAGAKRYTVTPWNGAQLVSLARSLATQPTPGTTSARWKELAAWLEQNPEVVPARVRPGRGIAWLWHMGQNHPWDVARARDAWPTATWRERTRRRATRLARLGEPLMEHLYAEAFRCSREPWSSWTEWSEELTFDLIGAALRALCGEEAGRGLSQLVATLKSSQGRARKDAIAALERALDADPTRQVYDELLGSGLLRSVEVDGTPVIVPLDVRLCAAWAARGLRGRLDLSAGWHRLPDPAAGLVVEALAERGTSVAQLHAALKTAPPHLDLDARLWELTASLRGPLGAWHGLVPAWRWVLLGCAVKAWGGRSGWGPGWPTRARGVLLEASRYHRDHLPWLDPEDPDAFLQEADPHLVAFARSWWTHRLATTNESCSFENAVKDALRQLTPWQRSPFHASAHPHGKSPWKVREWLNKDPVDARWALLLARERGDHRARDLLSGSVVRLARREVAEKGKTVYGTNGRGASELQALALLWHRLLPVDLMWHGLDEECVSGEEFAVNSLLRNSLVSKDWNRWAPRVARLLRRLPPPTAADLVLRAMEASDSDNWKRWAPHIELLGLPIVVCLHDQITNLVRSLEVCLDHNGAKLTSGDPQDWPWDASGTPIRSASSPPQWESQALAVVDRLIDVAGWLHQFGNHEPLRRVAKTGQPSPPPHFFEQVWRLRVLRVFDQAPVVASLALVREVQRHPETPAGPPSDLRPTGVGARWAIELARTVPPSSPTALEAMGWVAHWMNQPFEAPRTFFEVAAALDLPPPLPRCWIEDVFDHEHRHTERTRRSATRFLLDLGDEACWRDWFGRRTQSEPEQTSAFPNEWPTRLDPTISAQIRNHAMSFDFDLTAWQTIRPLLGLTEPDTKLIEIVTGLDDEQAWTVVSAWRDPAWTPLVTGILGRRVVAGLARWDTALWLDTVQNQSEAIEAVLTAWIGTEDEPFSDPWLKADPSRLKPVLESLSKVRAPWAPDARRRLWHSLFRLPLAPETGSTGHAALDSLAASRHRRPKVVHQVMEMLRRAGEEHVIANTWTSPPAPSHEDDPALTPRDVLFRAWTFTAWRTSASKQELEQALERLLQTRDTETRRGEEAEDQWHREWGTLLAMGLRRGSDRAKALCRQQGLRDVVPADLAIRAAPQDVLDVIGTPTVDDDPTHLIGLMQNNYDVVPSGLEAVRQSIWDACTPPAVDQQPTPPESP